MAKIQRNAPCPCGSGNKYKKCCLPAEQATSAEASKAKRELEEQRDAAIAAMPNAPWEIESFGCDEDLIDDYSNRVVELIRAGDLEGAEQACVELEEKFPDFIDCPDRRALLCEARGELEKAVTYTERCLEILADAPSTDETAPIYEEAITRLRKKMDERIPTQKA